MNIQLLLNRLTGDGNEQIESNNKKDNPIPKNRFRRSLDTLKLKEIIKSNKRYSLTSKSERNSMEIFFNSRIKKRKSIVMSEEEIKESIKDDIKKGMVVYVMDEVQEPSNSSPKVHHSPVKNHSPTFPQNYQTNIETINKRLQNHVNPRYERANTVTNIQEAEGIVGKVLEEKMEYECMKGFELLRKNVLLRSDLRNLRNLKQMSIDSEERRKKFLENKVKSRKRRLVEMKEDIKTFRKKTWKLQERKFLSEKSYEDSQRKYDLLEKNYSKLREKYLKLKERELEKCVSKERVDLIKKSFRNRRKNTENNVIHRFSKLMDMKKKVKNKQKKYDSFQILSPITPPTPKKLDRKSSFCRSGTVMMPREKICVTKNTRWIMKVSEIVQRIRNVRKMHMKVENSFLELKLEFKNSLKRVKDVVKKHLIELDVQKKRKKIGFDIQVNVLNDLGLLGRTYKTQNSKVTPIREGYLKYFYGRKWIDIKLVASYSSNCIENHHAVRLPKRNENNEKVIHLLKERYNLENMRLIENGTKEFTVVIEKSYRGSFLLNYLGKSKEESSFWVDFIRGLILTNKSKLIKM